MFAYIVRRILATIPVMAVVAVFVFALLYLSPGDPAAIIAGDTATVDDILRIRAKLGLDQPVYIQFGEWVWRLLHGDLGRPAAGAGLCQHHLRLLALPVAYHPAERRPRHGLRRADRAHHPRQHARRAGPGLHPHRPGEGARQPAGADRARAEKRGVP